MLAAVVILGLMAASGWVAAGRDRGARAGRAGARAGWTAGRAAYTGRRNRQKLTRMRARQRMNNTLRQTRTGRGLAVIVNGLEALGAVFWWLAGGVGRVVGAGLEAAWTGATAVPAGVRDGWTPTSEPPTVSSPPTSTPPATAGDPSSPPVQPGGTPPSSPPSTSTGWPPLRPVPALDDPEPAGDDQPASDQPERCPTCGTRNRDVTSLYPGGKTCTDPWHGQTPAPDTTTPKEAAVPVSTGPAEYTNIQDAVTDAEQINAEVLDIIDRLEALIARSRGMGERIQAAPFDPGPKANAAVQALVDATPTIPQIAAWAEAAHAAAAALKDVQQQVGEPVGSTGVKGDAQAFASA